MGKFGARVREYLRESADRKLSIGRWTISRLAIFGIAAVILLAAIVALAILIFGKRKTGLVFTRANVAVGYQYRMKDNRISYRTADHIYTFDCAKNTSDEFEIGSIDGYDSGRCPYR